MSAGIAVSNMSLKSQVQANEADASCPVVGGLAPASLSRPIVFIAGAIAPYTNRLYDAFAEHTGVNLHVLACVDVEPQRRWQMPEAKHYKLEVLRGLRFHRNDLRNVYLNPSIVGRLFRLRPRAIILGGFSPTMMMAAGYARMTGTPLGVMTDGSVEMDPGRSSKLHRFMRRSVIPSARVGICASENSGRLLVGYGLEPDRTVVVPIACPWPMPDGVPAFNDRAFDVLFCGALEDERKGAAFFTDVVLASKRTGVDLRIRVVGDGPLRGRMEQLFATNGVEAQFDGYVQPDELAQAYASAKLFAFPSRGDPWGLVANEALQCGTPVICSPHAVSSHELVMPYGGGVMVPLDISGWCDAIAKLLGDRAAWEHCHGARERARSRFEISHSVARLDKALSFFTRREATSCGEVA